MSLMQIAYGLSPHNAGDALKSCRSGELDKDALKFDESPENVHKLINNELRG